MLENGQLPIQALYVYAYVRMCLICTLNDKVVHIIFSSKCVHFLFEVSPETEMKIAVQALRLNTHSKLTFADSKRFDSLIQDVFPDVAFQDVEHQDLDQALRDACKETNLVVIESQVKHYIH